MGATATGKSQLAIDIAHRVGGEVISIDSRQVYRGMDIGTAKVLPGEREGIPHHLIDILDPDEINSAGFHASLARRAMTEILGRGAIPILAGGTGLYFRAIFQGLIDLEFDAEELRAIRGSFAGRTTAELYAELERIDPERARALSGNDRLRITRALEIYHISGRPMSEQIERQQSSPPVDPLKIVLVMPRFELRDRIARRTREMFRAGWIAEVESLLARGYDSGSPGMISLGYRELTDAIEAGRDPRETIDDIITHTRQYAKRQDTFFRSEPDAVRIDVSSPSFREQAFALVRERHHFKNDLT